jgi:hypothetical protein
MKCRIIKINFFVLILKFCKYINKNHVVVGLTTIKQTLAMPMLTGQCLGQQQLMLGKLKA